MKTFFFSIFIVFISVGCASSDKKSKASSQAVSDNQNNTSEQAQIVAKQLSPSAETTGLTEITGQLNYTGNEPFTKPAIFVSGSEMYVLSADETFIKDTFKSLNGKRATIYGKVKKSENAAELEVHYYEIAEN